MHAPYVKLRTMITPRKKQINHRPESCSNPNNPPGWGVWAFGIESNSASRCRSWTRAPPPCTRPQLPSSHSLDLWMGHEEAPIEKLAGGVAQVPFGEGTPVHWHCEGRSSISGMTHFRCKKTKKGIWRRRPGWAACSDHGIDFQVQALCWSNQKSLTRRVQPPRRWLLRASLVGRSDKTWCNNDNNHFTRGISIENQTTRQYSDGPALASRSCHSLFFSWGCHLDNLCGVTLCPAHATCVKIIQTGRF